MSKCYYISPLHKMYTGDPIFHLSRRHYVRLVDQRVIHCCFELADYMVDHGRSQLGFILYDSCDVHRWTERRRHGPASPFHLTAPTILHLFRFPMFTVACALGLRAPVGQPYPTLSNLARGGKKQSHASLWDCWDVVRCPRCCCWLPL